MTFMDRHDQFAWHGATADIIPGAAFEIIKNAGHISCVEQPPDLASRLTAFSAGSTGVNL